jgi:chaperone protein EcpD
MFRNIFCISLLSGLLCAQAEASIVMNNTRVIYNAAAREVTVPIKNRSSRPVLVQSWLDNGDVNADPTTHHTPFVILPPITRVEGDSAKTLRLRAVNITALPADRESVFWLNVLDVPVKLSASEKNRLQVALQSRVKVFYRPAGLRGSPGKAVEELIWRSHGKGVTVTNPTAWQVSLVSVSSQEGEWPVDIVAPGKTRDFPLPLKASTPIGVTWIDDNGGTQIYSAVTQ